MLVLYVAIHVGRMYKIWLSVTLQIRQTRNVLRFSFVFHTIFFSVDAAAAVVVVVVVTIANAATVDVIHSTVTYTRQQKHWQKSK